MSAARWSLTCLLLLAFQKASLAAEDRVLVFINGGQFTEKLERIELHTALHCTNAAVLGKFRDLGASDKLLRNLLAGSIHWNGKRYAMCWFKAPDYSNRETVYAVDEEKSIFPPMLYRLFKESHI